MSAHSSIVGGSNAGRILACPGSWAAIQALPPSVDVPSEYAELGTFAHEIMAHLMGLRKREPHYDPHHYVLDRMIGNHYYDRVFTREHYNDMIQPALVTLQELEQIYGGGFRVIGVEERVKFPGIPGAFGTCDLIITNGKWILHVDWKFGQGVPVKAEYTVDEGITVTNPQLMFYTAAAMHTLPKLYKGARGPELAIAIIQPRTDEALSHTPISRKEVKWFIEDLEAAVMLAVGREPPRAKGEHCRWAPCKVNCPLWTGPMLDLSSMINAPHLNTAPVSRETTPYATYLAKAKALADMSALWKKEIDDQLHAYLEDGGTVPGWRLKKKAKQRQWVDELTVEKALTELGFDAHDVFDSKLVTFKSAEATAKRLGVEIPENLRVAPPTNETTVCATDDPAPPVTRLLASEQFTAALADLSKST